MSLKDLSFEEVKEAIEEIHKVGPQLTPVLRKGLELLDLAAGVARPFIEQLTDYSDERKAQRFKQFLAAGFSRDEAMLLIIDSKASLQRSIENIGKNGK